MEEKYYYIKKGLAQKVLEFNERFNPELYNNLGETLQDYIDGKWVELSDEQVAFYNENPYASVGEIWNMALNERTIGEAKRDKIAEIDSYDDSFNVNSFLVNGTVAGWLTPEERSNYRNSIDAAKLLGIENLSLYIGDLPITLSTQQAERMLAMVQLYADQCYMVTKGHKAAVKVLENIADIDGYDYTTGYPKRLEFDVPLNGEE